MNFVATTSLPQKTENEEITTTTIHPKSFWEKYEDKIIRVIVVIAFICLLVYLCKDGTGYLCYSLWRDILG